MVGSSAKTKKIIHIDMDCFFAAIEIRDNPKLKNKPVAVGGTPAQRGVLATCNYIARTYGLHSALPTTQAYKRCPNLVLLPVNMPKYKAASKTIHRIFKQYTPLVEMLSLDEAFLDVSNCHYCHGSATLIATTIKRRIKKELKITASAGVAPNKFLAKVASNWHKPDGLLVITPQQVEKFVNQLPITEIFGVGKVTAAKLHKMQIKTCADLQQLTLAQLTKQFGKMGDRFYHLSRGIDPREVNPHPLRKSLSVETTFPQDLTTQTQCVTALPPLIQKLTRRVQQLAKLTIAKQFIKIKFADFTTTTVEKLSPDYQEKLFVELLTHRFRQTNKAVRLLGVGVKFKHPIT